MTFVTFVIAMAAIGAFYLYSTKPACREVVDNWSVSAFDVLQGKAGSSGQIIRQQIATDSLMQAPSNLIQVPVGEIPPSSTGKSGSIASQPMTGTSDDDKATGAPVLQADPVDGSQEKGLVTGEKKKKKKKSKSKRSKKKKGSKGNKKEGKKSEDTLPDDAQ